MIIGRKEGEGRQGGGRGEILGGKDFFMPIWGPGKKRSKKKLVYLSTETPSHARLKKSNEAKRKGAQKRKVRNWEAGNFAATGGE